MTLRDALKTALVGPIEGTYHTYKANISEEWCIGGIPQGGYSVGLILSAVSDLQSRSSHPDPVHLAAHYLQPVDVSQCELRVKLIRRGKRFTNIDADLIQDEKTKISTRIIYGVLPDLLQVYESPSSDVLTLLPTSPYGRQIPFSRHPAIATPDAPSYLYLFQTKAEDKFFEGRNAERAKRQSVLSINDQPGSHPDCGLEWGAWLELNDPEERLVLPMMPFFADCMKNLPSLLPSEQRPGPSWFATVVLTVEFKSRIPYSISNASTNQPQRQSPFSPRTVGVYASSRFMTEGRHDELVEIWTAPSTIGAGPREAEVDPKWRDKQVCLAISTQMALTIPEENSRRVKSRL